MTEAFLGLIYLLCLIVEAPIFVFYVVTICIRKNVIYLSLTRGILAGLLLVFNVYELLLAIHIGIWYIILINAIATVLLVFLLVKHVKEIREFSQ